MMEAVLQFLCEAPVQKLHCNKFVVRIYSVSPYGPIKKN
jgi:hypothetical protein